MMMIMMSMLFLLNMFNKFYMQMIIQNIFFFYLFMILINYPLNSLSLVNMLYLNLGMDIYSWGLILLSMWIINMMLMVSEKILSKINMNYYFNLIKMMILFLMFSFYSMNLFNFYIFFESTLIPMFLLILGWGYQIDRIQAGLYMMLYTLLGSLPLLLMLMNWYNLNFSLDIYLNYYCKLNFMNYFLMIFAFLIKLPMYFFHLWLPKAHVEAPVIGSMILAGVMLKLGGYGLFRVLLMMMMNFSYNKYFLLLSMLGGFYSTLICLMQVDMKMLVAYSSIVHMSMMMSGLFSMYYMGFLGGFYMMLAHGICSSGMFYLVNVNYERMMSRSLYINKGMINIFPSLSLMWFLLISCNISFPPSLNLISEIYLITALVSWFKQFSILLIFFMFFSVIYSLYLYSISQHGKFIKLNYMKNVIMLEYYVLILHWLPLNYLFMYSYMYIYFNNFKILIFKIN
uniref:NADH-ubiquinone oxidoreductase chain 4 n=1 Tax=Enicospilus sp. MD-2008 TaxID=576951 RepID=C4NCI9_9HYME|nr:NADH dehydrogenase subunit 4 [Enicospilus sp. MD-2008]